MTNSLRKSAFDETPYQKKIKELLTSSDLEITPLEWTLVGDDNKRHQNVWKHKVKDLQWSTIDTIFYLNDIRSHSKTDVIAKRYRSDIEQKLERKFGVICGNTSCYAFKREVFNADHKCSQKPKTSICTNSACDSYKENIVVWTDTHRCYTRNETGIRIHIAIE